MGNILRFSLHSAHNVDCQQSIFFLSVYFLHGAFYNTISWQLSLLGKLAQKLYYCLEQEITKFKMELLQPYGKYIVIGVAAVVGIAIILWIATAIIVMRNTKGIPLAINDFFNLIIENKIDEAYYSTSDNFQSRISKPQLNKLIKNYKFKQYQQTRFDMPQMQSANNSTLDATVVLKSGREIPLKFTVVRLNKEWKVDALDTV